MPVVRRMPDSSTNLLAMDERLRFRDATVEDAPAIASLLEELGHPLPLASVIHNIRRISASGTSYFVVAAVIGGRVVGALSGFATPVLHRPCPVGRLSVLVVDSAHAGSGVGSVLLQEAERRFQALGCERIEVTSAAHRSQAHEFYRRRGYHQQGLRFVRELTEEKPKSTA